MRNIVFNFRRFSSFFATLSLQAYERKRNNTALNVYNPATPFVGGIQGGLQNGTEILISGTPDGSQDRFAIDLQCGVQHGKGIAFHFNPQFNQNQVVRNTLQDGRWENEEREGHFPFQQHRHFDIAIHVQQNCYQVSVNNQHYCNYNHRIPFHNVNYIGVSEGVRLDYVRVEGPSPHIYPGEGGTGPIYNPPVPFRQHIGSLYPGKMIFVRGIPKPRGSRFTVYLDSGNDTAFVFDARFAFGSDRNLLVRNTMQNGAWGREERDQPRFPFQQDVYFEMVILVESHCFKVAVNNQHLLEYCHRIQPLNRIDKLKIEGDVKLCEVRVQ